MKNYFLKTATLLFIVLIINCSSNNDPEEQLPPVTQTGENTFGCLIDGTLLLPRNGTGTIYGADSGVSFIGSSDDSYNGITVKDYKSSDSKRLDIYLYHLDQNGEGTFTVNESNCLGISYAKPSINVRCRYNGAWYCSTENSGTLTITRYDSDNGIVSGTFSFTAKNRDDPTDSIQITQGRFDFHRPTINNEIFP
jgi:hypothetical protein